MALKRRFGRTPKLRGELAVEVAKSKERSQRASRGFSLGYLRADRRGRASCAKLDNGLPAQSHLIPQIATCGNKDFARRLGGGT